MSLMTETSKGVVLETTIETLRNSDIFSRGRDKRVILTVRNREDGKVEEVITGTIFNSIRRHGDTESGHIRFDLSQPLEPLHRQVVHVNLRTRDYTAQVQGEVKTSYTQEDLDLAAIIDHYVTIYVNTPGLEDTSIIYTGEVKDAFEDNNKVNILLLAESAGFFARNEHINIVLDPLTNYYRVVLTDLDTPAPASSGMLKIDTPASPYAPGTPVPRDVKDNMKYTGVEVMTADLIDKIVSIRFSRDNQSPVTIIGKVEYVMHDEAYETMSVKIAGRELIGPFGPEKLQLTVLR